MYVRMQAWRTGPRGFIACLHGIPKGPLNTTRQGMKVRMYVRRYEKHTYVHERKYVLERDTALTLKRCFPHHWLHTGHSLRAATTEHTHARTYVASAGVCARWPNAQVPKRPTHVRTCAEGHTQLRSTWATRAHTHVRTYVHSHVSSYVSARTRRLKPRPRSKRELARLPTCTWARFAHRP
jgi:hypothetical protein